MPAPTFDQVDIRTFPLAILYDFQYSHFHYLVQMVDDVWLGDFGLPNHFDQDGSGTEILLVIFDLVSWCLFVHGRRACETNVTFEGGGTLEIECVV